MKDEGICLFSQKCSICLGICYCRIQCIFRVLFLELCAAMDKLQMAFSRSRKAGELSTCVNRDGEGGFVFPSEGADRFIRVCLMSGFTDHWANRREGKSPNCGKNKNS